MESHKHLLHPCALQKPWLLDELVLCIFLTHKLSDQVLIYRSMSVIPYALSLVRYVKGVYNSLSLV